MSSGSIAFEVGDAATLDYTPAVLNFSSVSTAGDLTVKATATDHASISTSNFDAIHTVNRFWTLTNSGIAFTDYGATFTWVNGDQDAGFVLANTAVGNYNPSTWTYFSPTPSGYTAAITGATAFGDYQVGDKMVNLTGNFKYYNTDNTNLGTTVSVGLYSDAPCATLVTQLTGSNPQTTTSLGAYAFNDLSATTYYVKATTSATTDGAVNGTDAAQVNAWSVNPYSIEKVRFHAGDVTGGSPFAVNSTDALAIMQNFVNGTAFSSVWSFWKSGVSIAANPTEAPETTEGYSSVTLTAGSNSTVNMYGLYTGDFNRSYTFAKTMSNTLDLIHTGTQKLSSQQTFDLPIHLVNSGIVGAVSLVMNFPGDLVTVEDVTLSTNEGMVSWAVQGNELRIGWFSPVAMELAAGDIMATLHLKTTDAFSASSSVEFTLAANPANELADGQYDVIPDAIISIDAINASTAGIQDQTTAADPGNISLKNYPNPFSGITTLVYELPTDGQVSLEVYNLMGTLVTTLVNETQQQGIYNLKFDANMLPSGIYVARLTLTNEGNKVVRNIKMVRN